MIADIFYGNLQPCDVDIVSDSRLNIATEVMSGAEVQLRKGLDAYTAALLDDYVEASAKMTLLLQEKSFSDGFCVAAELAADVYCRDQRRRQA